MGKNVTIKITTNQTNRACGLTDDNTSFILIKPLAEIYLFSDSSLFR